MNENKYPGDVFTTGLLAFVLGIVLSIYSVVVEVTANRYRDQGVEAEATVVSGSRFTTGRKSPGLYSLDVTFLTDSDDSQPAIDEEETDGDYSSFTFTDADLSLGNFVSAEVNDLLSARLFHEALSAKSARVLYLPSDPEHNVVLADSVLRQNYPWIGRYELAIVLLVGGFGLLRLHCRRSRGQRVSSGTAEHTPATASV